MGEARRRGTLEERRKKANFTCIICRLIKNADSRSDEHVIPDSLNGYYHIYSVCKECNRRMGSAIDGVLLNNKLTQLYRFTEGIVGKKGKLPNPFSEILSMKHDPSIKVTTEVTKDGKLTHKYVSQVTGGYDENGKLTSFQISVDKSNQKDIPKIKQKFLERNNIKEAELISEIYNKKEITQPELHGKWSIDIIDFKLGLLKIAYEFAVDSIGDSYFSDPLAIRISNILKKADIEELEKLQIGSGFDTEIFEPFRDVIDLAKKRHILILTCCQEGLICFIKLDRLFHVTVKLSDKKYFSFYDSIIGLNDLQDRSFHKTNFLNLIKDACGKGDWGVEYWFPDEDSFSLAKKNEEIADASNCEVNGNGEVSLYYKNGKKHKLSISNIMKKIQPEITFDNGIVTQKFLFGDGLNVFVKSRKTKKLYEIRAFRRRRQFSKA